MNDHTYRTLSRYANSDLSELAAIIHNKPAIKAKPETLAFGSAFHTLLLEPEKKDSVLLSDQFSQDDMLHLYFMEEAVRNCTDLNMILKDAEKETVRQWTCAETGLPLKAKIDAVVMPRKRHIIDLKTTSCKTKAQFLDTCLEYNYDRQAAFYLASSDEAVFFEFVGVQKVAPYSIYRLAFHTADPFIETGRKKMNALLRIAKAHSLKEDGWRPSSWSRTIFGTEQ